MKATTSFLAAMGAATMLLGAARPAAPAENRYGTSEQPLEGRRYETLRALSENLAETARGALEGAADDGQRGASLSEEDRFLSSIRSFARGTDDLRRRVDAYRAVPFDVPAQVDALTALAKEVSDRIRAEHALENTYDDWDAILDVLGRMSSLLRGRDVEVPPAHVVAALSGPRLQEFRQLAHDLETSATQAHEQAKREVGKYPARGKQFLGELHYFQVQSRELSTRADAARVEPQQIGPIVDGLLEQARQADRGMRDAQVFTSIRDDSGRAISLLLQMASLVRS